MFKYNIYGLNVASEFELNCYDSEFDHEDVRIRFTINSEEAFSIVNETCDESDLTTVDFPRNLGKVFICGCDCLVVLSKDLNDLSLMIPELLDLVFSLLMLKRGIFVLHGNTVVYKEQGIVLIGGSGAGKSSLSAGFLKKGAAIVADDISRLEISDSSIFAYPSFPSQKLWKNTVDQLDFDIADSKEILFQKDKYIFSNPDFFSHQNTNIFAIIQIIPDNCSDVRLERVSPIDALQIILNNIYSVYYVIKSRYKTNFYKYIVDLCEIIPVFNLHRPKDSFTVNEQVDLITKDIINNNSVHIFMR